MNQLRKIQYNCRQATFLIEKRALQKLTFREHIELRIHLAGCGVCRLYRKQSTMIGLMIVQLFQADAVREYRLKDDVKQIMQQRIDEKLGK